ncbi:DUF2169 domain-containing protein [Roseiconus lacunae]|uniref:DUF2169 domain-containing protein n=1 Tax=Roseiconus lacunae TaxID=2605694 RepID=UPI0011F20F05|nr:DUF2169 domain-containing protein [Roseiconus lacunae]MCD0460732.1 DUF2169 domain-containing protein [Roseiconus lacunae]WRQ51334.1 DUF2169 domain-containing protein [Stieleria sp. HD01]
MTSLSLSIEHNMRIVLTVIAGPGTGQKHWRRDRGTMTIGRTEYADFVIPGDPALSSVHFELRFDSTSCSLRDLESSNGTQVNGELATQVALQNGDRIRAGGSEFLVTLEGLSTRQTQSLASTSPANTGTDGREEQQIVLPGQSPEGQHLLSILLKRTYDLRRGSACVRSEKDEPINPADLFYDDPMNTSVKFESDFCPFKLATDVVLLGKAYAPNQTTTRQMIASLAIGSYQKSLFIVGDRRCQYRRGQAPAISDPLPFESIDLRYENAYGGVDIQTDPALSYPYPRNHLGKGFIVKATKKTLQDLSLPNIEDPNDPLTPDRLAIEEYEHWERQPQPQGFGWYSKYCQPRAKLAGIMPADRATEQELRAMYAEAVPEEQRQQYIEAQIPDMDFRFFSGASPGLVREFLRGDEVISTQGVTLEGEFQFRLPGERPVMSLDIGGGDQQPEVVLHTVQIRMEDRQVDLVWRGAIPYPGLDWLPEMPKMEVLIG